jgi:hypothetical protein
MPGKRKGPSNLEISFGMDAAEMQKLVDGLYKASPEVVAKAREILGSK